MNPEEITAVIEKEIQKGYDPIYFMDDSPRNIKAVNTLKKKYPEITILTRNYNFARNYNFG